MIKICCNVNRLELMHHIEYTYLAITIAIPRSFGGQASTIDLSCPSAGTAYGIAQPPLAQNSAPQTAHPHVFLRPIRASLRTNGDVQLADRA